MSCVYHTYAGPSGNFVWLTFQQESDLVEGPVELNTKQEPCSDIHFMIIRWPRGQCTLKADTTVLHSGLDRTTVTKNLYINGGKNGKMFMSH